MYVLYVNCVNTGITQPQTIHVTDDSLLQLTIQEELVEDTTCNEKQTLTEEVDNLIT